MYRWFCPDCERLLKRAPYRHEDNRYHSSHCRTPMIHATVIVHAATADTDERGQA